jgi:alpha-tubulin suppressor-like RCC1 family protein
VGVLVVAVLAVVAAPVPAGAAGGRRNRLLAWGWNGAGQLGNGTTSNSALPVRVELPKGTTVVGMAAGEQHSLARTSTGAVLAWGDNEYGQLGNGTLTPSQVPVKVRLPKGAKVVAMAAGQQHSLAVTSRGKVLAWGDNEYGQLGNGTTRRSKIPVRVKLPSGTKVTRVAASWGHSLALTSRGKVLAWGNNDFGQLGDGRILISSRMPVKVKLPKGTRAVAVAAGSDDSLALTSTGSVWVWGENPTGRQRCGHTPCSRLPVKVKLPKGTRAVAVAAGLGHSLVLTSRGKVLAWGLNDDGQLGAGYSGRESSSPVKVKLPRGTKVTAVAAGYYHSLALTSTGQVLAWGDNRFGELGAGTATGPQTCVSGKACSTTPIKVKLGAGDTATTVRSGTTASHSLAIVHHT